jgi:hypothetical protein
MARVFSFLQICFPHDGLELFKHFRGLYCLGAGRRYWLPSLLEHEYVSLRFVTQASYEKAAQMRISPTPDVITRVFMLFRGVRPDDVGLWAPAATRATAEVGATFWTEVVGVDAVRASDRTLFWVLERGGMEFE